MKVVLLRFIQDVDRPNLGAMDVAVRRNAFGSQKDSFEADLPVAVLGDLHARKGVPWDEGTGTTLARLTLATPALHEGHIIYAADRYTGPEAIPPPR